MFLRLFPKDFVYPVALLWLLLASALLVSSQVSRAPSKRPTPQAEALYAKGMAAVETGDLNSAHATFEKVIRLAPSSPEAHNSLGWVLMQQGQMDTAIAQFRAALRLRPGFVQAHVNLANALSGERDFAEAESEAREAIRLAPKDSEAQRTLGRMMSFRGNL